eukprot:jgi/Mesvir1/23657/Mv18319-RA.1
MPCGALHINRPLPQSVAAYAALSTASSHLHKERGISGRTSLDAVVHPRSNSAESDSESASNGRRMSCDLSPPVCHRTLTVGGVAHGYAVTRIPASKNKIADPVVASPWVLELGGTVMIDPLTLSDYPTVRGAVITVKKVCDG